MKLEEYRTAKTALEKGVSMAPSESKFKKLIDECDFQITGIVFLMFCSCFLVDYVYMPRVIVLFANGTKYFVIHLRFRFMELVNIFFRRRERFGSTGAFDFAFKFDSTTSI